MGFWLARVHPLLSIAVLTEVANGPTSLDDYAVED